MPDARGKKGGRPRLQIATVVSIVVSASARELIALNAAPRKEVRRTASPPKHNGPIRGHTCRIAKSSTFGDEPAVPARRAFRRVELLARRPGRVLKALRFVGLARLYEDVGADPLQVRSHPHVVEA